MLLYFIEKMFCDSLLKIFKLYFTPYKSVAVITYSDDHETMLASTIEVFEKRNEEYKTLPNMR